PSSGSSRTMTQTAGDAPAAGTPAEPTAGPTAEPAGATAGQTAVPAQGAHSAAPGAAPASAGSAADKPTSASSPTTGPGTHSAIPGAAPASSSSAADKPTSTPGPSAPAADSRRPAGPAATGPLGRVLAWRTTPAILTWTCFAALVANIGIIVTGGAVRLTDSGL